MARTTHCVVFGADEECGMVRTAQAADELLADAFAQHYRYAPDHPGWTARCRVRDESVEVDTTVGMTSAIDVEAVPQDGVVTATLEGLLQDLRSFARTLFGHDFATGEGRFAKSLDDAPNPLGPLVVLHDDPHEATFRIRQRRVTMATRRQGQLLETVRVDRWHSRPDGRWLPAQWVAEVWDDAIVGPLTSTRYWDLYWPLGGELVPQMRRVDVTDDLGITTGRSLTLAEWQLG